MNRITAKKILWVQTIEESDASGAVFPFEERSRCTHSVLPEHHGREKLEREACEKILLRRSDASLSCLIRMHGQIASLPKRHLPWPLITSAICLLAFTAGMASDRIVNRSTINVISLPLLGILCWNFLTYLRHLTAALFPPAKPENRPGLRALLAMAIGIGRFQQTKHARATPEWDKCRGNFFMRWGHLVAKSELLTLSMVLHLGAASLAVGQIGSLYLSGLVRRYHAVWESTFLDQSNFEQLAQLLFAPAHRFTGLPIEITAQMEAGAEGAGVPAGNWIHLCAATLFLLVVVPRITLAVISVARAGAAWRKEIDKLDIVDYTDALLRLAKGSGKNVAIVNCCPELADGTLDHLIRGLNYATGRPGSLYTLEGPRPGEEDEFPPKPGDRPDLLLLIFPLNSTPEDETHGLLTENIKRAMGPQTSGGGRTLALLFADRFESRFRSLPEFELRLRERERAWSEVLARRGITSVTWNTGTPVSDLGRSLTDALAIPDEQSMVPVNR
jgi:hypothetical protein